MAVFWNNPLLNPTKAIEGPFTIEEENRLLGSRQHRKVTKYDTFEEADARAMEEANRSRSFAWYNVLDRKGHIVSQHQGTK